MTIKNNKKLHMKKITFLFILLSGIVFSQTASELQKLKDFAKTYGIVRYFHPSDEASQINWNHFASYGIEQISKTKNQKEFEETIKNIFSPVAPSVTFNDKNYVWNDKNLVPVFWIHKGLGIDKLKEKSTYSSKRLNRAEINGKPLVNPDAVDSQKNIDSYTIDWDKYVAVNLSNNFNLNVPTVVYSDEKSTLPVSDKQKFDELKSQLKPEEFNKNIALANVIISWNIFKHFSPYQDVVKTDWDKVLEEALKDAYDDQNEDDNYLTLKKFTANFDDGHMSVYHKNVVVKNKFAPGIALRFLNNELIVKNVSLGIEGIEKGDVITKINGTETQKVIADLQQYISGSKQLKNWMAPLNLLRGAQNSTITLTLKNNKQITVKRDREYNQNADFYTREDVTKSKEINSETYYVNMDKLSAEEMEAEIPKIRKYKNLIIDLRGYPRTDQAHRLLNYLLPTEDSTKWLCGREIYLPDFKNYKETCNGHRLRKFISDNPLKTNNVLLVDERSVSNAEMFSQVVKHYKLATIVGRTTAGANGNRNDFHLLNEFTIGFTGLKVTNPDGSQFHAVGVVPDIFINETQEDIKNGKDVFVEKALEIFNKK